MNHQDNVRIFAIGVEDARREQQARGQEVGPSVDLKLTVDLSKRNIDQVPHEAVDLLTLEVERLQLAHNQISRIPDSFSQCRPLKYLNLRGNLFVDVPNPLLSLPHLEILDLSINEIQIIPESIRSMRSLRVLSLTRNKIWDLPSCIKDLDTLRMLKLAGNPLRPELASIVAAKDTQLPFDESVTDNEKETFITSNLKHHLKVEAANESGEGSSEGPLETPRPFMRNGSLRFPVKANGSASEPASELRSSSPAFAPPIPARSHFRVTSGQNHLMQRRPGLAPLSIGNERNRSNSESILQATQNNRSKRMGMVPKKKHDLGTVEESQQNRTSWHLRGKSHASALRDWSHEGDVENSAAANHDHASLQHRQNVVHPTGTFVGYVTRSRRQRKPRSKSQLLDATMGVRFSLNPFDQCTLHLIESLPCRSPSSWSKLKELKDAQHWASMKAASLHRSVDSLFQEAHSEFSHRFPNRRTASMSINASSSAVDTYIHLGNLLLNQSSKVLANGNNMYVRALVLQTFASCVEMSHAFHGIGRPSKRNTITQKEFASEKAPLKVFGRSLRDEPSRDQSLTPTRERPVTAKRVKDWNLPQQRHLPENIKQTAVSHFPTTQPAVPQTAAFPAIMPQSAVPLYLNGRSRSNSRADQANLPSSTDSTFALSPAMTPSSMGAFSVPGTPLDRSRSSSVAAGAHTGRMTPASMSYFDPDPDLQRRFDKIHNLLDQTVQLSRKALPKLKEYFIKALTAAQTNLDQGSCEECAKRVRTCSMAAELSSIMLKRLQAIKQQQPQAQHPYDYPPNLSVWAAWNDRPFWELCKKFLATISDLLMDVRAACGSGLGLVPDDVLNLIRPVSALSKATSHEILDSPWNTFLSSALMASSPGSASVSTAAASAAAFSGHHRQRGSSGDNSYAAGIPPTPLSAALGPAAQATVPSTPASSGSLERSFQGSFSERADTFLQSQQQHTMVYRR
ncbi:MAG: hypothetical protein LQ345_002705 [Seirophora villosa]|nr:MAG: hypothetical protein LQ345_002705 [Seirophora villosa]